MPKTLDIYDREVERLTVHPEDIINSWIDAKPLFRFCDDGRPTSNCGCLTRVKRGNAPAATPKLTEAIRSDERIPTSRTRIRPEHLPVFAEWQRRIDKELNRKPPEE